MNSEGNKLQRCFYDDLPHVSYGIHLQSGGPAGTPGDPERP